LMHCQYIVSIYNGINTCAGLFPRSLLCSQCFLCLWIIHSRLPLQVSLTFNNIDIPHDIRVLQGKTLTNNTDTYFKQNTKTIKRKHTTQKTKKMSNIEHLALTEHCRISNITPSPSEFCRLL
jgi:hypothetical protein